MQSKLILSTKLTTTGKTRLDKCFISPPFKLLPMPTQDPHWPQGLNVIQMSSSPGLLAGDNIDIEISLAKQTALSLTTQAFTRIQSMNNEEYALQQTKINLAEGSRLFYLPHPLVLHKDCAFKQQTHINMAEGSTLIYAEIIATGRVLNNERFAFRHFASHLKIYFQHQPLLYDCIQWLPNEMNLTALSQMEDYSHQGSLVYLHTDKSAIDIKQILSEIRHYLPPQDVILSGISQLNESGLILRVLAHRADVIQSLFEHLGALLKEA
ncbi:MAG TPA: urease accessory protein [Pasteurellaceae bacterium]|nr:urease accessory protein [Pasteurellaceae bacterium]